MEQIDPRILNNFKSNQTVEEDVQEKLEYYEDFLGLVHKAVDKNTLF